MGCQKTRLRMSKRIENRDLKLPDNKSVEITDIANDVIRYLEASDSYTSE